MVSNFLIFLKKIENFTNTNLYIGEPYIVSPNSLDLPLTMNHICRSFAMPEVFQQQWRIFFENGCRLSKYQLQPNADLFDMSRVFYLKIYKF